MLFRKMKSDERELAIELVWNVFMEYEAPEYSAQGIEEFRKSIHDSQYLDMLRWYGAFMDQKLAGVIATRNGGSHIALFFVDGRYQGQGIGKHLLEMAVSDSSAGRITVNSSPYAVPVYHRLGFSDTGAEQTVNGIRFTPMEKNRLSETVFNGL